MRYDAKAAECGIMNSSRENWCFLFANIEPLFCTPVFPRQEFGRGKTMALCFGETMKICSKCKMLKSESEFYKCASHTDGLKSSCKECCTKLSKEIYQRNGYKYRERRKEYYQENIDKEIEYARQYRKNYPEKVRSSREKYIENNLDAVKESAKRSNEKRRGRRHEYNSNYYLEHKEYFAKKDKLWRKNNPGYSLAYQQRNRERCREYVNKRRARIKGVLVEYVSRDKVYERDGGRCHLCHKKVSRIRWHLDHIIPLHLGGEHSYKNVAVSCPECNLKKGYTGHSQLRLFGGI